MQAESLMRFCFFCARNEAITINLRQFEYRMTGKIFAMLSDTIFLARAKKGKWEVYNSQTEESIEFDTLKDAAAYKINDTTIESMIEELDTVEITRCGGRGASGGESYSVGGNGISGDGRGTTTADFPARVNTRVKVKSEHEAIQEFRKMVKERDSSREHGIEVDRNGFAYQYRHGGSSSIQISSRARGTLIVHNHPNNSSFSKADLLSTSQSKNERGVVATHSKGYRKFEKGSHFKATEFMKAVSKAKARGKDFNDATDKWLKRNQRRYGYKFTHVLD